ncbi:MAG: tetraacyldisaccharide 4'-kinase [Bdellovibrionaceae bacterium]|nr:tetraacyldisaccharide 4'-kinase [Bdellovibrionales bacterium]MCB9085892.1 tetraacyldisaccharide 4'-kinase [Pseudobdellovibrionaceae bacterium]
MLTPLSWIYTAGMKVRNWGFEQGLVRSERLSVPVVSVGNLTAGGTGKTPIVSDLVDWSIGQDISVGVVSRGYKGQFTEVTRVPSDPKKNVYCGDEPTMLARRYPDVPVYVHPDRVSAGKTLLEENQVRWILADDAFQHRRLRRDLNLVVFDATAPLWHLRPLPAGRAREPLSGLGRADFIILTKTNLADEGLLDQWRTVLDPYLRGRELVECEYRLSDLVCPMDSTKIQSGARVWLVSGIGNPRAFEELVRRAGVEVAGHTVFQDHHAYTPKDVIDLRSSLRQSGTTYLVSTSKDVTKLQTFEELGPMLVEARLGLKWNTQRESLINEIDRLVR